MEKLILLKPQGRRSEEAFIDNTLAEIGEEIGKLRKRGVDTSALLMAVGKLLILMGDSRCRVEQYAEKRH